MTCLVSGVQSKRRPPPYLRLINGEIGGISVFAKFLAAKAPHRSTANIWTRIKLPRVKSRVSLWSRFSRGKDRMRGSITVGLGVLASIGAGAAAATPSLEIKHAVARVTIIPEARGDIVVTVTKTNSRLPLKVTRMGDSVMIDGDLGWRSPNCHTLFGHPGVSVWGAGDFRYDDLPQVVVHVPRNTRVGAGGAVFGAIGPGDSVDLGNSGCGDWTVADQTGPLHVHVSGSGDVRAGSVGAADVSVSGSGDVNLQATRGGLVTGIAGSGDVTAASVTGPLRAHVSGSGDVRVHGGAVTDMDVSVAGSGDIHFGGVAQSLNARIAGSGDVSVAKVTGLVAKHIAGSGDVSVGR